MFINTNDDTTPDTALAPSSTEDDYIEFWLRENQARTTSVIHDFGFPLLTEPGVFSPQKSLTNSSAIVAENLPNLADKTVLDIGTGTGVLAIAALRHNAEMVVATDIEDAALKLAHQNFQQNRVADRVKLIRSDLLQNINGQFDLIIANLPLIGKAWGESDQAIAAMWERLFATAPRHLTPQGRMYFTLASFADEAQILDIALEAKQSLEVIITAQKFGITWTLYAATAK